jgi:hypothetical protein
MPDYLILGSAFLSFVFSVSLWFGVVGPPDKDAGLFVAVWVPSILAVGTYVRIRARQE